MKKNILRYVLIIFLPFMMNAHHVYIWNFDTEDTFYDPQISDTIDCTYWLEQTLTANGHTYITGISLPGDLSPYDVIFVTLGWYRC
jgi:hypothetical protein